MAKHATSHAEKLQRRSAKTLAMMMITGVAMTPMMTIIIIIIITALIISRQRHVTSILVLAYGATLQGTEAPA